MVSLIDIFLWGSETNVTSSALLVFGFAVIVDRALLPLKIEFFGIESENTSALGIVFAPIGGWGGSGGRGMGAASFLKDAVQPKLPIRNMPRTAIANSWFFIPKKC